MPFYRPEIGPHSPPFLLDPEERPHRIGQKRRRPKPGQATPSPDGVLDDGDLLLREAVQLVNQGVDLPVGSFLTRS
jgi:hypothetical protein